MATTSISTREFLRANAFTLFRKALRNSRGSMAVPTIGLCVSGGADSMALAFLFRRLQVDRMTSPFKLKAFIVDHQARKGSAAEAQTVSRILENTGVPSEILTMEWPAGVVPLRLSNFESLARTQRYRILAKASISAGVNVLCTGHHCDDQVETILTRLMQLHKAPSSALQGMKPLAPIPCCADIYGAQSGGPPESIKAIVQFSKETSAGFLPIDCSHMPLQVFLRSPEDALKVAVSAGGISIMRPLLFFPKDRLVQTCLANGVEFIQDSTNFDPTTTIRNAIRFLRTNHKLPRALSASSILELRDTARRRLMHIRSKARLLIRATRLISMDLRSGVITLQLEEEFAQVIGKDLSPVAYALARILQIVDPVSDEGRPSMAPKAAIERFISLASGKSASNAVNDDKLASSVALGRVMMCRMIAPQDFHDRSSSPKSIWQLSRQPLRRDEIADCTHSFKHGTGLYSDWLFWDCRYWIRIKCRMPEQSETFTVRPLRPLDLVNIRRRLEARSVPARLRLEHLLKDAAPGKTRWTLPIISNEQGVCAFPTLDFWVDDPANGDNEFSEMSLQGWEVHYKAIHSELRAAGFFRPFRKLSDGVEADSVGKAADKSNVLG